MLGLKKGKFVLSVGDDGAVLTYSHNSKLRKRLYAPSPSSDEVEEFKKLFALDKKSPIYILVDIHDQSYIQHNIPNVSSLAIKNIIKRRLDKDFTAEDIKAALKIDRAKTGRKDWNYLFVSVRNAPPLSEWLDMVVELPNFFAGIFMLPVEIEQIVKDLEKSLESQKGRKDCIWKIFVVHNRVGGLRQVVLRNNKIIITRMNQPVGVATPDVIAGNIEQDLQNTIEFIRRMGFEDKDGLDVYSIVSSEVCSELVNNKVRCENFFAISPREAAEKLKMPSAAQEQDKFADVIIAMSFAAHRAHVLKMHTNYTKKLEQLANLDKAVLVAGVVFTAAVFLLLATNTSKIVSSAGELSATQESRRKNRDKMQELQGENKKLPFDAEKVVDTIYFNEMLSKNRFGMLDMLEKFAAIKPDAASVTNLKILKNLPANNPANNNEDFTSANLSIELRNPGRRIEQMIDISESFRRKINAEFKDYEIKLTNFPGRNTISTGISDGQSLTQESAETTVQVLIEGPKKKP